MEAQGNEENDEYDKEFITLLMEIEKNSINLKKHDQIRVKSWCKKLCQITNNVEWKKNRNLHCLCLLYCIINNNFEEPYNRLAPEGTIPTINKTLVKVKINQKFLKNLKLKMVKDYNYSESPHKNEHVGSNVNEHKAKINNQSNKENNNENIDKLKEELFKLDEEGKIKDATIYQLQAEKIALEKKLQELEEALSGQTNNK